MVVYEQLNIYDPETKKYKTKRKYLGIWKDGHLVPTSGKRGRPKKQKDPSVPIKPDKEVRKDVELEHWKAEAKRLQGLLEDIEKIVGPALLQLKKSRDKEEKETAKEKEGVKEQLEIEIQKA